MNFDYLYKCMYTSVGNAIFSRVYPVHITYPVYIVHIVGQPVTWMHVGHMQCDRRRLLARVRVQHRRQREGREQAV